MTESYHVAVFRTRTQIDAVAVTGEVVPTCMPYTFFVHKKADGQSKYGGNWAVSEESTGAVVVNGDSALDAARAFDRRLNTKHLHHFKVAIKKWVEHYGKIQEHVKEESE